MEDFIVKNKVSIWLCFAVLIVSALMMQPSFTALICLVLEVGILFLLRTVAHIEGRNE